MPRKEKRGAQKTGTQKLRRKSIEAIEFGLQVRRCAASLSCCCFSLTSRHPSPPPQLASAEASFGEYKPPKLVKDGGARLDFELQVRPGARARAAAACCGQRRELDRRVLVRPRCCCCRSCCRAPALLMLPLLLPLTLLRLLLPLPLLLILPRSAASRTSGWARSLRWPASTCRARRTCWPRQPRSAAVWAATARCARWWW